VNAIKKLFDHLYQDKNRFVPNDVEVDAFVFTRRLNALSMFLKKTGEEARPVSRIITNIRGIDGELKIESMTQRIFDNLRNPILSKALLRPEVREILRKFCQQWDIEKQELLTFLEKL